MKVIVISGKAGHGKDTAALMMKEELEARGKKVLITHYGDLTKYVCKTFFDWDGNKDEYGRTLLQHVGTDVVRTQNPDFWVNFILDILLMFDGNWDYVFVPDARFLNEILPMKRVFDSTHVRVRRPGYESQLTEEQQNHISETALDDCIPDWIIENDSDLAGLKETVHTFIEEIYYGE